MAEMLAVSDWEFKTTMITMLIALMEKVDNILEQVGNVSREMETNKTAKEIL